jgi:hypothetical protein
MCMSSLYMKHEHSHAILNYEQVLSYPYLFESLLHPNCARSHVASRC